MQYMNLYICEKKSCRVKKKNLSFLSLQGCAGYPWMKNRYRTSERQEQGKIRDHACKIEHATTIRLCSAMFTKMARHVHKCEHVNYKILPLVLCIL